MAGAVLAARAARVSTPKANADAHPGLNGNTRGGVKEIPQHRHLHLHGGTLTVARRLQPARGREACSDCHRGCGAHGRQSGVASHDPPTHA